MAGTWKPSGAWLQRFREGLVEAFEESALQLLTSDYFAPRTFLRIAPQGLQGGYEYRVYQLIEAARMEDWLLDLVAAASERRPKNAALREIAAERGLTAVGPRLENNTGTPLEAMLEANAKMINLAKFHELLPQLEARVCWIQVPGSGGTGFLVGPDLVLTNHHVVEPVLKGATRWQDVNCQFDYRQGIDGTPLDRKKNTVVKLVSKDWLIDSRPASGSDWSPALGEPAQDEVDYALVRLADGVGSMPVGGASADPSAPKRLWFDAMAEAPSMTGGNQLFMLQHPESEPLQMSIGSVLEFNKSGNRLRHGANSKHGSSGSPCFNVDLELVALHHAHDPARPPKWNQAIPLETLQRVWRERKIALPPSQG